MKKTIITFIVLLLSQILCFQKVMASDFKMVKKQGDITLYERWIKGGNGEAIRELKAEFIVKSNPENVVELLKDQPSGMKWNENASLYKIAATQNANQWINYIKYNMPALMDDQECCLLFKYSSSNAGIYEISFSSALCPLFPSMSGVKRITGIKGKWILKQQPGNNTKITYLISSDRNKNIPRFLSDPIVHNNLFKTMENFKNILEA